MNDLPNIAILLLTYRRTQEALRTINSTCKNLGYPKENISFYVADDGSPKEHLDAVVDAIRENGIQLIGYHNEKLRHPGEEATHNAGLGWNRGMGICHQHTDYVLICEDDWEMENSLDLVPHVKLLRDREDVGIVSFRILSTGADVHTIGHEGRHYIKYLRTTQYAFSGNPHIRHARYTKRYGWYAEDRNPGLIELHQDDQYRLAVDNLIDIWRPLDINLWGGWFHIGSDKTW